MIVAAVSTYYAYLTFKTQREHNIKSVRPILHVGQYDYENRLRVDLVNQGLGPAQIRSIVVQKGMAEKTAILHWLPTKLPNGMNYKEYLTSHKNWTLRAGERVEMIEIPCDHTIPKQREVREELRKELCQLTVRIEYEDLYGNKMPALSSMLSLFSRPDNENSSTLDTV